MTREEQALADDKMRAEIANLTAQTSKLNAETAKILRERFMLPVTVYSAALIGLATLLARLFTAA